MNYYFQMKHFCKYVIFKDLLRERVWREQCRDYEADKLGILLPLEPNGDGRGKDLAGVQHAGQ